MTTEDQKQPAGSDLIWLRLARARQDRQPTLSREQIVRAAIEIADSEGTQALSMRRLAAKLNAGTMSLYWYIARKEDLFDLLADEGIGEIVLPEHLSGSWRADLALFAQQTRAVMLRHPWLASMLSSRPGLGPHWLKHFEFFMMAIDHLGLTMTEMAGIFNLVDGYVMGFVQRELEEEETIKRTGVTEVQWQETLAPYMQQLVESGAHPYLARYLSESEDRSPNESFAFGLERLLDGIAVYIDGHTSA